MGLIAVQAIWQGSSHPGVMMTWEQDPNSIRHINMYYHFLFMFVLIRLVLNAVTFCEARKRSVWLLCLLTPLSEAPPRLQPSRIFEKNSLEYL